MTPERAAIEAELIEHFLRHIVSRCRPLFENKEAFRKLNIKYREALVEFLGGDPTKIFATEASYVTLWVAAYTAMEAMDKLSTPAANPEMPLEMRSMWNDMESDWRNSTLLTAFQMILTSVRSSIPNELLPLDMQETEGRMN